MLCCISHVLKIIFAALEWIQKSNSLASPRVVRRKTFNAYPIDYTLLDEIVDDPSNDGNFDLTYDQRQNGTENIRLRVDGVVIAFPASTSSQASSSVGNLAANYLLQLAAQSEDDEDSDFSPFLKNSNGENGVTAPTDDKNIKKKSSPGLPRDPVKENNLKRIVLVKDVVKADHPEAVAHQQPVANNEEQSKFEVIPIKKVQSRRKNKHKLRLAGLLDFLPRYKEQY